MTGYLIRLTTVLGWGILLIAPARAQQEEPDLALFSEAVQVHVVNVDVYATDKEGNPITDLTAADFEISEDGKPMEITHFSLLGGEQVAAELAASGDSTPRPGELGSYEGRATPPSERLWLVVYIDNLNLRPGDRKRALDDLRAFLDTGSGTHTKVMVASYDRELNIRQPFTRDPARINESLTELETLSCEGARFDASRRAFLERLDEVSNQIEAVDMLRPHADQVLHDLTLTLVALQGMIERISGLPGRKAILYVSSGLPRLPAMDLFMAIENRFPAGYALYKKNPFDATGRFDEVAAAANAHGVTLYMLGAAGVPATGSASVEKQGPRSVSAVDFLDGDRSANLQLPLRQMADETGGQAIVNRNDFLPALEKVASDFQTYYSLGYTPDHTGDGLYHAIAVKVRRPDVRLRHRSGYRDKSSTTTMSEGVRANLLYPVENNPLRVAVGIGEESEAEQDRFLVPIDLFIPLNELVLLPDGEVSRGRLRLFLAAMDEEGKMTEVIEIPAEVEVASGDEERALADWGFSTGLRMRRGHYTIAVGVRDELGAVSAFTTRAVTVGAR